MEDFERDQKNGAIVYFLMVVAIILNAFIIPNVFPEYTRILNVALWFVIFLKAMSLSNQHNRFKGQVDKIKAIFIIVAIYLMGYYLSGLFFGYSGSIYSRSLVGILKNFGLYISVIIFREYTRSRLVNNTQNYTILTIITVLFEILSVDYYKFGDHFLTGELAFKYVAGVLYPTILRSVLCTFLVRVGSYKLSLMFILPQEVLIYITPIFPAVDWFVTIALDSALVLLTFYYVNYEHLIHTQRFTREEIRKGRPRATIPVIVFVVCFTFFVAGLFPVRPVALVSNSMKPWVQRGDVVIVKRLKEEEKYDVQKGDIIEYFYDNRYVVHRVIDIKEDSDGKMYFITKGDNNEYADVNPVYLDQVKGITKYYVPMVGFPSVWFSELILKEKK